MQNIESLLTKLFGKYLPGHYDSEGNFIPGDIKNRLLQVRKWIVLYNVEDKYNPAVLRRLVTIPSGWQSRTQSYLMGLSRNPIAGLSLTTIAIIGGIIYLIMKK